MSDFEAYIAEARQESSQRGAAILMACNVELALDYALRRYFSSGRAHALFGMNKPLGGFANKILIGYALNIFGDEAHQNLETIRRIRNAFAHAQRPIKFTNAEVADACSLLKIPGLLAPAMIIKSEEDEASMKPQRRYEVTCERLGHNLGVWDFGGPWLIDRQALKVYLDPRLTEIRARPEPLP